LPGEPDVILVEGPTEYATLGTISATTRVYGIGTAFEVDTAKQITPGGGTASLSGEN
jgi:hypothetical protein